MNRNQIASFIVLSFLIGIVAATFLPSGAMPVLIFVPFLGCIVLGWTLAIQNRGLNLNWIALISPLKPFLKVQSSRTLVAFGLSSAFALGSLIGLLVKSTHA